MLKNLLKSNPAPIREYIIGGYPTVDPRQYGDLRIWIDASDTTRETLSGDTVTKYIDKGAIASEWVPTVARAPIVTTEYLNGKRGYKMVGGSGKNLETTRTDIKAQTESTLVAFISITDDYFNSLGSIQTYGTLFSVGNTATGQLIIGNSSALPPYLGSTVVSHWNVTMQKGIGTSAKTFGWMNETRSMMHVYQFGTKSKQFRGDKEIELDNKTAGVTVDTNFSLASLNIVDNTVMIGGLKNTTIVATNGLMVIHELLEYSGTLSEQALFELNLYGQAKWGINNQIDAVLANFSGQSNAVGLGVVAEAPVELQSPAENAFTWLNNALFYHTTATTQALAGYFGSDVPFCREYAALIGKPVIINKNAASGQGLEAYFIPPSTTGWTAIKTDADSVHKYIHGHGMQIRETVNIFIGCETDANSEAAANNVASNLHLFSSAMSSDLQGGSYMLTVVPTICKDYTATYRAVVNENIERFTKSENAALIDTSLLTYPDDLHLNTAGYLGLGTSLATACATRRNQIAEEPA